MTAPPPSSLRKTSDLWDRVPQNVRLRINVLLRIATPWSDTWPIFNLTNNSRNPRLQGIIHLHRRHGALQPHNLVTGRAALRVVWNFDMYEDDLLAGIGEASGDVKPRPLPSGVVHILRRTRKEALLSRGVQLSPPLRSWHRYHQPWSREKTKIALQVGGPSLLMGEC